MTKDDNAFPAEYEPEPVEVDKDKAIYEVKPEELSEIPPKFKIVRHVKIVPKGER